MASSMLVLTPISENAARNRKHSINPPSSRNIPLFNSPKIRRSLGQGLGMTPAILDQSLTGEQNDDEEELRQRQRQRKAELQQQNLASPSTPSDRRKSMGPATGMTNAAIVEHYANCIKLSAENKINIKNAFNLQLIDCMSEMLRKKDPEMNNFQAASCTLDASTKIYAYRVDCVHNDTLKMAGGLGRTGAESNQDQQDGENAADGEQEEDPAKAKKKTRRKNKKTIETNVDSLNLNKFDLEYDVDPLFKKNCATFDEGRNGGVNFLSTMMLKDDGCQLILDSDSLCNSTSTRQENPNNCFIPIIHGLEDAEICPTLKGFSFTSWDPENEDLIGLLQSPAKRKLDDYQAPVLPAVSDDHAFDMDAIQDYPGDDSGHNHTHIGMEDIDEDEGIVDRQRNGADGQHRPVLAHLGGVAEVAELRDQLSSMPLEYSYFGATARSAWAGPLHWRFKPAPKPVPGGEGNQEAKKKRRKAPLVLNFQDIPNFGKDFDSAGSFSKLNQTTLVQWVSEKITLPEDLHFDPKEFYQSFTRPLLSMQNKKNTVPSQDLEDILSPYDYSNRRDAENFCPPGRNDAEVADSDNDDHHDAGGTMYDDQTADFGSQNDTAITQTLGQFSGSNLVAAPNMVAKIQINYARVAKKMDMKRLKSTMWNMLSQTDESDSQPTQGNPKPFSTTYHQIPGLLPQKMADNLSVALAFAALLHLANENNLSLEQLYGSLDDFVVVHPKI